VQRETQRYLPFLLIAAWFGLVAGLLDAFTCFAQGWMGSTIRISEIILWISPVFHAVLLILGVTGLWLLSKATRLDVPLFVVVGLVGGIAFFCWVLRLGRLPQFAAAILSLGVGVQLARMTRSNEQGALRFLKRSFVFVCAVALVTGTTAASWAALQEQRFLRGLPPAPSNAPNVLLITLDTLRADHMSAYGYPRATTPFMDRLAQGGVLFESAFANSSWTLPSHASLLTGRLPEETGANWRSPLKPGIPTLAEAFASRGYRTVAIAANTAYVSPEWGLGRGFSRFEVYGGGLGDYISRTTIGAKMVKVILPWLGDWDIPGRKRATQVNHNFLAWLEKSPRRPFFALLNYLDVHDPYLIEAPYQTKFSSQVTRGDVVNFQFQGNAFRRKQHISSAENEAEVNGYDGCLAYLDAQLDNLFAALEAGGFKENTLVIVTSDHGEAFGNHDLYGHGNSLYVETLRVPLIVYWPGKVPAGQRVQVMAGLDQIPASVADLLGWKDAAGFSGQSLASAWLRGDIATTTPAAVFAQLGSNEHGPAAYPNTGRDLKSIVTERWHLIMDPSGNIALYAWRDDPAELNNLAQSAQGQAAAGLLKDLLLKRTNQKDAQQ
jgi:arylsulfatase A-like enzyme